MRKVLITGMPRSGTSLLAQIVHRLGFDFGVWESLVQADNWAPDGYYERYDLVQLNQRIMSAVGGDNVVPGYGELPDLERWAAHEKAILDQVQAAKVPRAAFFLPLYDLCAPGALWVISVRHPAEVAASWERAYGKFREETLRYWVDYYSRLAELPVGRSLIVSYDGWFMRPEEQMMRLCRFLDKPYVRLGDEVKSRHRHATHVGPSGHVEADELYRRLLRCA